MTVAIPAAVIVLALVASLHIAAQRHADQLRQVLGRIDSERHAWARERSELLSRIQHPHLVPAPLPVAPPGESQGGDKPSAADPFDDEFHLVGKILDGPVDESGKPLEAA